jgi:iron complex outermembrane receptor protein
LPDAAGQALLWVALVAAGVGALSARAADDLAGLHTAPATSQPAEASTQAGQELSMYEEMPVVITAGRREQTQQQFAGSVSVVDAQDIELFGDRSLADVLRTQRSFYLHTDGLNWMAGVRGLLRPDEFNTRILVLIDGRPTNELIFGQSHLDQDFSVPMEAVKQIEVVRGPGSALYGSNAVAGVVSVTTKDGADINGVQVRLQGGTQDTGRASVLFGKELDHGWDVMGCVTGFSTDGDTDIYYDGVNDAAHNYGHITGADQEAAGSALFKARHGDFTAQLDFEDRQADNRSATYLTSWFDPGGMDELRTNATFRVDHEVAVGQTLHAMAYYSLYRYHQQWTVDGSSPPYHYTSDAWDDWLGGELNYNWQVNQRWSLLAGAEGRQGLNAVQQDHDDLGDLLVNQRSSYSSFGVFGEAEFQVADWLSLTAGGRLDYIERLGMSLSPRLAAVATPTKEDTFKALYGRAFRAPTLYEMFYFMPAANTPNPNLRPEVVDNFELIWERRFHNGWQTTLDGYFSKMSDAIESVAMPDGSLQTQNVGIVWAHGIEAEVQKRWDSGAQVRAYASLGQAQQGGVSLACSPAWIVGGSLAVPVINQRSFLALEPQIVAGQKSDLGDYTNPTFLTNVVFTSRRVIRGLDVQVGIYNLFASYVRQPHDSVFNNLQPTLDYPGTTALVSLTYHF